MVQGLTEFLPVSSSGHLVLFGQWLGVDEEGILFEVALHAATLLAVVVFYRRRIAELVMGVLRREPAAWRYGLKLAVATVPTVVAALVARDWFEGLYETTIPVALGLGLTGALVMSTRWTLPRAEVDEPGWAAVLVIGLAQVVAIVPGVSRSGSTVAAGLALGVRPAAAAEFSFLMSVIAICGAVVLQIPELQHADPEALGALAIGSLLALASGLAALYLFIRLLRSQTFHHFAWYVWPLAALVLLL